MSDEILKELKEDVDKKFLDYRLAGSGIMAVVFTISAGVIGSFAVTDKISSRLALCLSTFSLPMVTSLYQQYLHYYASKFFADGLYHRLSFFMDFPAKKVSSFEFEPSGTKKSNELFTDTEKWFVRSLNLFLASLTTGSAALCINNKWDKFLESQCLFLVILGIAVTYTLAFFIAALFFKQRSLGKVVVKIHFADGNNETRSVG